MKFQFKYNGDTPTENKIKLITTLNHNCDQRRLSLVFKVRSNLNIHLDIKFDELVHDVYDTLFYSNIKI